jgi:predicted Rossmann-fold nucleotide-binding protein
VLFDSDYWDELLVWVRKEALADRMISAADVALLTVTDDPQEAVECVIAAYEDRREREAVEAAARHGEGRHPE